MTGPGVRSAAWRNVLRAAFPLAAYASALSAPSTAFAVPLVAGDFVLVGSVTLPHRQAVVMKLDGTTLDSSLSAAGGLIAQPRDVVVTRSRRILVADYGLGVIEVDAETGSQSIALSASVLGGAVQGICEGAAGELLLSISGAGSRIVRWTGGATSDVSADGLLLNPGGLELGADGMLYVANTSVRTSSDPSNPSYGSIVRVNPADGAQTWVSQDRALFGPFDLTFGPDGFIWTTNQGWISGRNGCHVRTNPATGESAPAGTIDCRSEGVARGADGRMLLSDCHTVGPDCYMPFVAFAGEPARYSGMGGWLAVVPAQQVTPARRTSWGQLKAIYR